MITLGIETSGSRGSIAISVDGELSECVALSDSGRRHAKTLVPEISSLLSHYHLTPRELSLICVSIGPGSFTGLRVGLTCAKVLAYALKCPLVGVDTFLAIANQQKDVSEMWVIDDALRGDVFAGFYAQIESGWNCQTPSKLMPFSEWSSQLKSGTFISGPGLKTYENQFECGVISSADKRLPLATDIAVVGEKQFHTSGQDDPWKIAPFYMRRSAAEEKADGVAQPS